MTHPQYILNRLPIGLILLDRDRRVVSYSGLAADVFGEDLMCSTLGKPIQESHSDKAQGKIDWLFRQASEEGTSGFASMLINMPNKVLQLRMLQLKSGSPDAGYCLLFYDITDLTSLPAKSGGSSATQGNSFFRLPISSGGKIALLDIDQVAFLHAEGHYAQVYSDGRFYFCNMSLSQLESKLPPDKFFRVHRSYIVNVRRAQAVQFRDDQYFIMLDGAPDQEIPVSRSHVQKLKALLGL